MIKKLARSIREYKKPAILTPFLVTGEVILECIIPFIIANLVNQMQAAGGDGGFIADFGRRGRQHLRRRFHGIRAQPAPGHVLPDSGLFL